MRRLCFHKQSWGRSEGGRLWRLLHFTFLWSFDFYFFLQSLSFTFTFIMMREITTFEETKNSQREKTPFDERKKSFREIHIWKCFPQKGDIITNCSLNEQFVIVIEILVPSLLPPWASLKTGRWRLLYENDGNDHYGQKSFDFCDWVKEILIVWWIGLGFTIEFVSHFGMEYYALLCNIVPYYAIICFISHFAMLCSISQSLSFHILRQHIPRCF